MTDEEQQVIDIFINKSPEEAYAHVWSLIETAENAECVWLKECRKRGFSVVRIGKIMERNHSTVTRKLKRLGIYERI